jgi:hypothetical protein
MDGLGWLTIAILVLIAIVGVVAAFYDRTRSKQIQKDLGKQHRRPPDDG